MSKTPAEDEITASLDRYRRWATHSTSACGDDLAAANTLRAALAAKDAEIERLWEMAAGDEITMRRLEKERDAAENRGFREAAEWLAGAADPYDNLNMFLVQLCVEADRREKK